MATTASTTITDSTMTTVPTTTTTPVERPPKTTTDVSMGNDPVGSVPVVRINAKAIASLVCAIIGICFLKMLGIILGPMAILWGMWAKYDIRHAHGRLVKGEHLANVGIALGAVDIGLWIIFLALYGL